MLCGLIEDWSPFSTSKGTQTSISFTFNQEKGGATAHYPGEIEAREGRARLASTRREEAASRLRVKFLWG